MSIMLRRTTKSLPALVMDDLQEHQKPPSSGGSNAVKRHTPLTPTFHVTLPENPPSPGFPPQIRSPLPHASLKSRLTCSFLNKFQLNNLRPTNFPPAGLFSTVVPHNSYSASFTASSDMAHASGLSQLSNFHKIEITISTCAITSGDWRTYRLSGSCEAYDKSGRVLTFLGYNGAPGQIGIKLVHDWYRQVRDWDGIRQSEDMEWHDIIKTLRDVAKIDFTRYGEVRRIEDSIRLKSEWARAASVGKTCIGPEGWMEFLDQSEEWKNAGLS